MSESFGRGVNVGLVIMLLTTCILHDVHGLERSVEVMRFNWLDTWSVWNILLYVMGFVYLVWQLYAEVQARSDARET